MLLPSKLPTARILTFGYDAFVADWRGEVSQNRMANHAWNPPYPLPLPEVARSPYFRGFSWPSVPLPKIGAAYRYQSRLQAVNPLTLTATDLQGLLARRIVSSAEVVLLYLAQIAKHSRGGLTLNAVISVADEETVVAQAAERLDTERDQGKLRGPLHGVPILVKVSISTDVCVSSRSILKLMVWLTRTYATPWTSPQPWEAFPSRMAARKPTQPSLTSSLRLG